MKIFSSMMAAIGRQLKQSVNVFQSLMLYRRLPEVKCARQVKPKLDTKKLRTFVVKPIYSVDAGALVITSQDEEVFRVFDFVCK